MFLFVVYFFKKNTRTIFWCTSILLFVATLLLMVFKVIKFVNNSSLNFRGFFLSFVLLGISVLLAVYAEKWNKAVKAKEKKLADEAEKKALLERVAQAEAQASKSLETGKEKDVQTNNVDNAQECQSEDRKMSQSEYVKKLMIQTCLFYKKAHSSFMKAISLGLIEVVPDHLQWNGKPILLSYFCGRVFCGDKPEIDSMGNISWKISRKSFPVKSIVTLFVLSPNINSNNIKLDNIGQLRNNAKNKVGQVPQNHEVVDELLKE